MADTLVLVVEPGTLFVVGTPIGNLEDLGDRARRVLVEVDLVAAEDTRRAGLLLKRIGGRARFLSFFEANERERVPQMLGVLRGRPGRGAGERRRACRASRTRATGSSRRAPRPACRWTSSPARRRSLAALVASGLPTDRFAFEGFLPRAGRARRERLAEIAADPRTVVLFESPRRTARTLADLLEACGDRRAAVCRELTKVHQEVLRGPLSELAAASPAAS